MAEIELRIKNMHWMANVDPYADCCVHGGIYLRIGQRVISDGKRDWSISTAAFNFLRTIFHDHYLGKAEALVPCCGFNMWPIDSSPDGLYIPNCANGIDWSVRHEGDILVHAFESGEAVDTGVNDWAMAVCEFADEVLEFFHTAWPKSIREVEDRKGFELFMKLWQERRTAAGLINASGKQT